MISLNPKYKALGNNTKYFIITGGRGSSKSFAIGTFICTLSLESDHKILYTRHTMSSAHLSIIPEFLEKASLLEMEGFFDITKTDIRNKSSGSEIYFRGLKTSSGDQTANLKSLQGTSTWVVDEAEELTDENKFDDIALSIRSNKRQNRIILILNPATKEHWIYKRFYESAGVPEGFTGQKDDVTYIHTTYMDNLKHLPQDYIKSIEDMKVKRPEKYKHKILGGWLAKAEGVVFADWSIGEFNDSLISVFGQDFGFSVDPTTLIEVAIDKSLNKIYVRECFYKTGLTTSQIYELNKGYANSKLVVGDSAEPRLIYEVKNKGCNIVAVKKGKDSIIAGISMMQDYDIIVTDDSLNVIKELNNYSWHDKKSQTPVDNYNHCIDAIRYAVYYQLSNPNKGQYAVY